MIVAALAALTLEKHYVRPVAGHDSLLAFTTNGERRDFAVGGMPVSRADDPRNGIDVLDFTFDKVRGSYYKPVVDADLLNGERKGLTDFLKSKHFSAQLPGVPVGLQNDASADETQANDMLTQAFNKYGSKVGDQDLSFAAVSGMLGSLGDPYTVFLAPREMRSLTELINGGDFGGIGVYIGQDPKTRQTMIIEPILGTPADRAGLRPGDIIVSVDGRLTKSLGLDPVMNVIRGRAGSTVQLLVKRGNAPAKVYTVVREQIHVPSVQSKMLGDGVGYIQLVDFGDTSAKEVSTALDTLLRKGAKAFILDLRNNGGGLLQAAVDVSSKFVADGPIVSTIDRQGQVTTQDANQDAIAPHPLAVLVNQYSASASEITAGAIQDSKAGVLIGTKTFGKGVVQTIFDLPGGGSAIKVTTARYVTPSGRDINKKGIAPNVSVPMDPRAIIQPKKDVQLKAALDYLKKQLALSSKP
ncbi:MAG: S41 family peptidase [Candidatus Eremiobacteraeota bacterium]|nr:S41 family peptidase [Candidatus Eremiobacteraeota bacterium]